MAVALASSQTFLSFLPTTSMARPMAAPMGPAALRAAPAALPTVPNILDAPFPALDAPENAEPNCDLASFMASENLAYSGLNPLKNALAPPTPDCLEACLETSPIFFLAVSIPLEKSEVSAVILTFSSSAMIPASS